MPDYKAYTWVSVAGGTNSIAVVANDTVLRSVFIPGTYIGTIAFYDSATVLGTTATNQIVSFGLPTSSVANELDFNVKCQKGLVYTATGTPILTFSWGY